MLVFYKAFQHFFESHVTSVGRPSSKNSIGLLLSNKVITEGVGVHGQDTLAEEGFILIVDDDLGKLTGEVSFETLFVSSSVIGTTRLIAVKFVEGNIVTGEEFITLVNLFVHALGNGLEVIGLGEIFQFVNPGVNRRCGTIHHAALLAENTRLHIVEVILT